MFLKEIVLLYVYNCYRLINSIDNIIILYIVIFFIKFSQFYNNNILILFQKYKMETIQFLYQCHSNPLCNCSLFENINAMI